MKFGRKLKKKVMTKMNQSELASTPISRKARGLEGNKLLLFIVKRQRKDCVVKPFIYYYYYYYYIESWIQYLYLGESESYKAIVKVVFLA